MLIAVVLLFILCWTPFVVDDLLSAYSIVCQRSLSESMKYMRMAFALMAYCNSCVNPVVYAFMCKRISTSFIHFYKHLMFKTTVCLHCTINRLISTLHPLLKIPICE